MAQQRACLPLHLDLSAVSPQPPPRLAPPLHSHTKARSVGTQLYFHHSTGEVEPGRFCGSLASQSSRTNEPRSGKDLVIQ